MAARHDARADESGQDVGDLFGFDRAPAGGGHRHASPRTRVLLADILRSTLPLPLVELHLHDHLRVLGWLARQIDLAPRPVWRPGEEVAVRVGDGQHGLDVAVERHRISPFWAPRPSIVAPGTSRDHGPCRRTILGSDRAWHPRRTRPTRSAGRP